MQAKLTKKYIDELDYPERDRLTIWDTQLPAFGLVVTPVGKRGGGVKSYIVQYRCGGRGNPTRRVTIGRHGHEWQPATARDEAAEILRQVRKGADPFEERRLRREQDRREQLARSEEDTRAEELVFATFREAFVEEYAKPQQARSWPKTERALKDAGRMLDKSRIDRITRDTLKWVFDDIKGRSMSAAIEAHKALGRLFRWAVSEGKIERSPMLDMPPPGKDNIRDRVLTGAELREVWQAAEQLGYPFGPLILLLIATGQRLRQVSDALWGEIDLERRVWLVPPERVKADDAHERKHLVPLNDRAMRIIKSLPRIAPPDGVELSDGKRPLFTTKGDRPVSGFSKAKTRLDESIAAAKRRAAEEAGEPWDEIAEDGEGWTNHDIRRTLSTSLQALGVAPNIIDLIQAHVVKNMTRVARHYQHWQYFDEKRDALDLWSRYLDGVVDGDPAQAELVKKVTFEAELGIGV